MNIENENAFMGAYRVCSLWASEDHNGIPLDTSYAVDDLSDPVLAHTMTTDCLKFLHPSNQELRRYMDSWDSLQHSRAGHDFWLTRNGHGAGFWDGVWPGEYEDALTEWAKSFGECNLYVGDDGKLYIL